MNTITLNQAKDGFDLTTRTANKSKHTLLFYRKNLKMFSDWLASNGRVDPPLKDITSDDIRQFILYLQGKQTLYDNNHEYRAPIQRPYSPYTIRGIFATLTAFFNWAVDEDLIQNDPTDKVKTPKTPKIIRERFSEDELAKLLDVCKQYPVSVAARNKAMIYFLIETGVRANELCTLKLEDLDLDRRRAKVTGKGMKDREVYFGVKCQRALWNYITVHRPPAATKNYVFLTHRGTPITGTHLAHLIADIGERAGVPQCNPHRFRHTAVRMRLRNRMGVFAVQALMGHEDIKTTKGYVKLESVEVEQEEYDSSPTDNSDKL